MVKILKYLLTTKANGMLYYIFVYVQFVIITPLLGKLALSKFRWFGWIVSPVFIFVFKYLPVILKFQWNDWDFDGMGCVVLRMGDIYYLGMCLGNVIIQKGFSVRTASALYLGYLLIHILEGYCLSNLGMGNVGLQLKISNLLTSSTFLVLAFLYLKDDAVTLCHIMVMKALKHIPWFVDIWCKFHCCFVAEFCLCGHNEESNGREYKSLAWFYLEKKDASKSIFTK